MENREYFILLFPNEHDMADWENLSWHYEGNSFKTADVFKVVNVNEGTEISISEETKAWIIESRELLGLCTFANPIAILFVLGAKCLLTGITVFGKNTIAKTIKAGAKSGLNKSLS